MSVVMQARSSTTGAMVTWSAPSPDWSAILFPGPGTAQYVAVAATQEGTDIAVELLFCSQPTPTSATIWTRVGARSVDLDDYPVTSGGKVREVRFEATLESTVDALWSVEVHLIDVTHVGVEVDGTALSNSVEPDKSVPTNIISLPLTVGSSSGDLRADVPAMYACEFRVDSAVGDPLTDRGIVSNARIVVRYV